MGEEASRTSLPVDSKPPMDGRLLVEWLSQQPTESQGRLAQLKLHSFLEQASQPRHASGNACIKLCYYIECLRASSCAPIQDIAFAEETCLDLFNFYVEWNEKNQNRSMRQVLELLSSLIARNPNELTSEAVKKAVLTRTLSIITHQTAQSLVKPAFKVLECFLNKKTVTPKELLLAYKIYISGHGTSHKTGIQSDENLWDSCILGVFDWMVLPDVSPAAGKFLVTLFKELKPTTRGFDEHLGDYSALWQRWIRNGLAKDPQAFENVKNYLFPPLFKIDRPGSLAFLESLNQQRSISALQCQDLDAHSLLQLAAMDVGKKAGLVEEPSTVRFQKPANRKPAASIVLQEESIGNLMCGFSDTIRSLAFSVLVSSASSIRPFSPVALDLFQSFLGILYSDTDAKFRNETLTNTKHMIERIRGAMAFLVRELDQVSFKLRQGDMTQQALYDEIKLLLVKHENFVEWYLQFLLGELVPTASYQRHITSLKAVNIILQSGIMDSSETQAAQVPANSTVWPFKIDFFTSRSMRLLLDLLMDPFEDVRIGAAEILALAPRNRFASRTHESLSEGVEMLKLRTINSSTQAAGQIPSQDLSSQGLDLLLDSITKAKDASRRTGRADYADGVARSYRILYGLQTSLEDKVALLEELVHDLEIKVEIARADLAKAVVEAPVHANFATLNLVWEQINPSLDVLTKGPKGWEQWIDFVQRLVRSCFGIWEAVQDVLCNDSPEGHLPQELNELEAIDTKDVLSYSFRAIHESSNLMRTIVNKLHQDHPDSIRGLAYKSFAEIGDLTFAQLSTLRHRGAFSTVSLTFAVCCQLTQHPSSGSQSEISGLLRSWWKGTIDAIHSQASTTRRSAGIPALITGIMSANAPDPSFEEIMAVLKLQARSPANVTTNTVVESTDGQLPQVHALNGLRETFKDSAVRRRAEVHVLDCLHIASDALNSETWAIRNCGLLLFQSLINYLIGTQSKEKTEAGWDGGAKAISYEKYPNLGELLLQLLDAAAGCDSGKAFSNAIETIFPVLDILRRAGPPEELLDQILTRLLSTIGHKIWHIRDLSARTFCVLTPKNRWIVTVQRLLETFENHGDGSKTENQRHGALLAAKLLLEQHLPQCDLSSEDVIQPLSSMLEVCFTLSPKTLRSPFGLAAMVDLQNTTLAHILSASGIGNRPLLRNAGLMALIHSSFIGSGDSYTRLKSLLGECGCPRERMPQTSIVGQAHTLAFKQAVYLSAIEQDVSALRIILDLSAKYGMETIVATLECVSEVWIWEQTDDVSYRLAEIHIAALQAPISAKVPGVRAAALSNLCSICDAVKDLGSKVLRDAMLKLNDVLSVAAYTGLPTSPSLEIAQIRISGISVLSEVLSSNYLGEETKSKIHCWGMCLRDACRDEKDFDTRSAAGQSLQSFLKSDGIQHILGEDCLLEALLVLYDSLIDDDEEIREIGATTISSLTRKLSTPLQARRDMEIWLAEKYNSSSSFTAIAIKRMTGEDPSAQIMRSLDQDDSLFVEESLNLFIDDVRELKSWVGIFHRLSKSTITEVKDGISPLGTLASWVIDGLDALTTVLGKDGGPLGCISKPSTYFACLSVVIITKAFLDFVATHYWDSQPSPELNLDKILLLFKGFVTEALKTHIHEDLLFEIISTGSLAKLEKFFSPEVTGIWKKAFASNSPR